MDKVLTVQTLLLLGSLNRIKVEVHNRNITRRCNLYRNIGEDSLNVITMEPINVIQLHPI